MASFTINIPANRVQHLLDGFCSEYHHSLEAPELTEQQFAKKVIIDLCKRMYKKGKTAELNDTIADAHATATTESEDITI